MQFWGEIDAKCNINVFGSFIFSKLHLKYKKHQKVQNRYFLEMFLQSYIHIPWLLICDVVTKMILISLRLWTF